MSDTLNNAAPAFHLRTLGAAELFAVGPDGLIAERLLTAGKPLALLAYCTAMREREHSRDLLATLLWGDVDSTRARKSLRQALWRVRHLVGDALQLRDDAVLGVTEAVACDRDQFLAAVHAGDAPAALAAYGGPFLPGLTAPGSDEFDDWAAMERRHLEESLLRVVGPRVRQLLASERRAQARDLAEQLLTRAPDSLGAHTLMVDVALATQDRPAALRAADALEAVARSLGNRAIADAMPLINRARAVDVSNPVDTAQPLTFDLVGRDATFSRVLDAWGLTRAGHAQVAVLSGAGGIGKSRLLAAIGQRITTKRTPVARARANPGERDVPFACVAAIAHAVAELPGASGISTDSARELVALDPSLGSRYAVTPAVTEAGDIVRRRALALVDLCSAVADQQPWVLLLDDLHWADQASRQVLSMLIGRTTTIPWLVVTTTRESLIAGMEGERVVWLPLAPLSREELREAAHSAGAWPDTPESQQFLDAVLDACQGIPLQLHERLSLGRERGVLQLTDGAWHAENWAEATQALASVAPLDQRLMDCPAEESRLLLVLALAGSPVTTTLLADAVHQLQPNRPDVVPIAVWLRELERKGLIAQVLDRWAMGHDVIAERVIARASQSERLEGHRALSRAMASAASDADPARALRHAIEAQDDRLAGAQLTQLLRQARTLGEHRDPRALLAETLGYPLTEAHVRRILAVIPRWHRFAALRVPVLVASLLGVAALSGWKLWQVATEPSLALIQSANVAIGIPPLPPAQPDISFQRLYPTVIVGVLGASASADTTNVVIRARVIEGSAQLLAGDSAMLRGGQAVFAGLKFRNRDSLVTMRFEATGYRPVDVRVPAAVPGARNSIFEAIYPVSGTLNGTAIDSSHRRVTVPRGQNLGGAIEVSYSNNAGGASVWLSMTPTWGDPASSFVELQPLRTSVKNEPLTKAIAVRAPDRPGRYWLVFLMDAEPSGGFEASRTSWKVGAPIWNDGNDLAAISDSTAELLNRTGTVTLPVAYPRMDPIRDFCNNVRVVAGTPLLYCPRTTTGFAIEVIVQ